MRRALAALLATILAGVACAWWLWRDMQSFLHRPLPLVSEQVLIIEPGSSLNRVITDLSARGWVSHPYYVRFEAHRRGIAASIKSGEYLVPIGTTPAGLLQLLVSGKVIQHALTLVEGWTFDRILAAVESDPHLTHTLSSRDPGRVMAAIGRPGYFAEGRFFPDTYLFPTGTTDTDFLRRAFDRMEEILEEEWPSRQQGLPYSNPYQALIMASLVERESASPAERGMIAGVFVRRLQRGMKLQTDPTVIYALGAAYDGNIRRADLALDSPYNTYVYAGLPPTPIAAPGRESIRAALQPAAGNELYFVARGDGTHQFSATLEEHNRAVGRYQLRGRR